MANTARRPILLFDVMETLVTEPYLVEMPAFFGMTSAELRAALNFDCWIEFEYGRINEAEYLTGSFLDRRAVDGDALLQYVKQAYRWLDGMEALVNELKQAGFQVHAFSNYPVWYRLIEERLQLSRYLSWTFVSCLTGLRKPEPEAYLNAATTLGVSPSDCLFVDDRPVNVDGARSVGMDAILREDTSGVRAQLVERGLLPA